MKLDNMLVRSIDTAPRDGTMFTSIKEGYFPVGETYWDEDIGGWQCNAFSSPHTHEPTHWVIFVNSPEECVFGTDGMLLPHEAGEEFEFGVLAPQ